MNIFVVIESAIYRHDVIGVFSSEENAISAGKQAARNSRDDHHRYEVVTCILDSPGETPVCDIVRKDKRHIEMVPHEPSKGMIGQYVIDSFEISTDWPTDES